MSNPLNLNNITTDLLYFGVAVEASNSSIKLNGLTGRIDCKSLYLNGVSISDLINFKTPTSPIQQFSTSSYYITGPLQQFSGTTPAIRQFV